MSSTCLKCGGTFKLLDGSPCPDCRNIEYLDLSVIPMQYRTAEFEETFVNTKDRSYAHMLKETLAQIVASATSNISSTYMICARKNKSKTIWASTLIKMLIKEHLTCTPVINLREYSSYMEDHVGSVYSVAFIRLPRDIAYWECRTVLEIVDTRVRAGLQTVFIFDGSYKDLRAIDKEHCFDSMSGDGSFYTWRVLGEEELLQNV